MQTVLRHQNVSLMALAGLVVALVALLAWGWHNTVPNLGRDLPCENDSIVNTQHIASCINYDLYTRVNGDPVDNTRSK